MAVLNFTGFETGDTQEAEFTQGTFSVQASVKRTGGYALRVNPTGGSGSFSFQGLAATGANTGFAVTKLYVTAFLRFATLPSGSGSGVFRTHPTISNTACIEVRVDSAGNVFLHNGTSASANAATLSTGVWYRIEFTSETSGTCELKVDGGSTVTLTASGQVDGQLSCGARDGTHTYDAYIDDVIVKDDAYAGAGEVRLLTPDGNGTYTAWSTGTGSSDYQEVDDLPHDSDTTYTASATSGQAETVTLTSTTTAGIAGAILAAKALAVARHTGTNPNLQLRLRSGSTDTDTTSRNPTVSYTTTARVFGTDPNTSAAWTASGLDAVEVGVEINANQACRCTCLSLSVWSVGQDTPELAGRPFGQGGQRQMHQLLAA